jgi:hypothetical protein
MLSSSARKFYFPGGFGEFRDFWRTEVQLVRLGDVVVANGPLVGGLRVSTTLTYVLHADRNGDGRRDRVVDEVTFVIRRTAAGDLVLDK